jgi:glycine/D-amino acid oxidase-like deaminating enzyme
MSPPVTPVASAERLPARSEVVVLGGGIGGIATAFELARRGVQVTVIEKGVVSGEQSSRNWGWCRQQNRDLRELPLAQVGLKLWREMNALTGEETGFREKGLVYATTSAADIATWEAWGRAARDHGVDTRMLTAAEVSERLPGNAGRWIGGVHSPTDGHAEPGLAVPAMARAAQRLGAVILQDCAARAFETTGGRVSAVVTERGRIACSALVVAGGVWTGMFLRHHGIKFLQASVKSTSFATMPAAAVIEGGLSMENVSLRRRLDGGYTVGLNGQGQWQASPWGMLQARAFWRTFLTRRRNLTYGISRQFLDGPESFARWTADTVSPFERNRVLDPAPDAHLVARGLERIGRLYPALAGLKPAFAWGGMVDMTPDAIPVLAPIGRQPGLYVCSGFSAHGFGIGPGAGLLMADLVTGARPVVDPQPFRYERMVDGTDFGQPGMI